MTTRMTTGTSPMVSARDCIGWEEDMVKNEEYFLMTPE
jgi:hypothetical protein